MNPLPTSSPCTVTKGPWLNFPLSVPDGSFIEVEATCRGYYLFLPCVVVRGRCIPDAGWEEHVAEMTGRGRYRRILWNGEPAKREVRYESE